MVGDGKLWREEKEPALFRYPSPSDSYLKPERREQLTFREKLWGGRDPRILGGAWVGSTRGM